VAVTDATPIQEGRMMMKWHRILVTAYREWPEPEAVYRALDARLTFHGHVTIIHGDCPSGGDLFARQWAEREIMRGMRDGEALVRHEAYPALWDEFGKPAGPMRNKYMVQLEADECLAFPMPPSRGTISCMKLAQAAGITVINKGTVAEEH